MDMQKTTMHKLDRRYYLANSSKGASIAPGPGGKGVVVPPPAKGAGRGGAAPSAAVVVPPPRPSQAPGIGIYLR